MTLETEITVGNDVELGFDKVKASTSCVGFIHLTIPRPSPQGPLVIELKRSELIEFMLRTQPNLEMCLRVGVNGGDKAS